MSLYLLNPDNSHSPFPPVEEAEREPNGLLALGGDLSPARLLNAYHHGIFPWYNQGQPIMWWSPDPRTVLFPERMRMNRSLRKAMRNRSYQISIDRAFNQVIRACAAPRPREPGTWITHEMRLAYERLHRHGFAHSVEIWADQQLIGGLYGVRLGCVFFGESMFSRQRDSSKIALAQLTLHLQQLGGQLIDCQIHSQHLIRLGAETIPRRHFSELLARWSYTPLHDHAEFGFDRRPLQLPD